jgi:predicted GNAT superfamily acetyltransferase
MQRKKNSSRLQDDLISRRVRLKMKRIFYCDAVIVATRRRGDAVTR